MVLVSCLEDQLMKVKGGVGDLKMPKFVKAPLFEMVQEDITH